MAHTLKHDAVFLKTVVDTIPMSVIVIDDKKRVFHLNDHLEKILNVSSSEAEGKIGGEVLGCLHILQEKNHICGQEPICKQCILHVAASSVFKNKKTYHGEGVISLYLEGVVHNRRISVSSSPLSFEGRKFALIIISNFPIPYSQRAKFNGLSSRNKIIGNHREILELHKLINEAAQVEFPVLLQGESGTGKELVARAIHDQSQRRKHPFVALNCSALPRDLLESELFGHVKGAFTGAFRDKKGRFEMADRGTLFLDEIGELAPEIQIKLLRFLQENTFEKVGDDATNFVDIRIITATNKVLKEEVQKGLFRLDLFYRINVIPITIPPLRKRKSDIPILTDYFMRQYDELFENKKRLLTEETRQVLARHDWPGNVRELENVVKYSLMKCQEDRIKPEHLPTELTETDSLNSIAQDRFTPAQKTISEQKLIDILKETDGNKTAAAEKLGISRMTLYRYLKKHFPPSDIDH